jgi:hypothetical protein
VTPCMEDAQNWSDCSTEMQVLSTTKVDI